MDVSPFMNTYHRLPVTLKKGRGAMVEAADGRKFIDFSSGIAVNCLGHNNPELVRAVRKQAGELIHTSNYFESEVSSQFARKLTEVSKMKKVFLCNSGGEANEGAIKIARKYSLKKYGEDSGRHKIVTLLGSFHGRTITTLSATGQEKFHRDFSPFTDGFVHIPPNDIPALEAALDGETCALMMEAVQGESGVKPLDRDFVKRAAELCKERDILLIFDEVQCGTGRTGKFFAFENYGVKADIATLAKGLAGGIPVGAVLANAKTAGVFESGDHGSTFGGNPLAAAAGLVVLEKLSGPELPARIRELGSYLKSALKKLRSEKIREVRGMGLMLAADLTVDAWPVLVSLIEAAKGKSPGLLLLSAGEKTLRFLPPYIISKDEIDAGTGLLGKALS